MVKRVNDALKGFSSEAYSTTELTGVIGCTDGIYKESKHSYMTLGLGTPSNPKAVELREQLGVEFAWTVTKANHKDIIARAGVLLEEARKARPVKDSRITPEAHALREKEREDRHAADEARSTAAKANRAALMAKRPAWAQAVILAIQDVNTSDITSDYFAHKTERTVAIGWRSGKREDFHQLRAAAATFPETAHLGPGCAECRVVLLEADGTTRNGYLRNEDGNIATFTSKEAADAHMVELAKTVEPGQTQHYEVEIEDVEHRENYSMGAGNYLKAGSRHADGWTVVSRELYNGTIDGNSYHIIEDHLPEPSSAAGASSSNDVPTSTGDGSAVNVTINNRQQGVEIRFPSKPEEAVISKLKSHGWRWARGSRCWYKRHTVESLAFAEQLKAAVG